MPSRFADMNDFEYKVFEHVHMQMNTAHISTYTGWATLQWGLSFITALCESLQRSAAKAISAAPQFNRLLILSILTFSY